MAPPLIFDRLLLRARRQRGLRLGPETFLIDQVADEFANRLRLVLRRFGLALDLGTPTAAVRTALSRDGAIDTMIALDPVIGSLPSIHRPGPAPGPRPDPPPRAAEAREGDSGDHAATAALRVVADEEAPPFAD